MYCTCLDKNLENDHITIEQYHFILQYIVFLTMKLIPSSLPLLYFQVQMFMEDLRDIVKDLKRQDTLPTTSMAPSSS